VLNEFLRTVVGVIVRVAMLVAGLIFLASVLAMALILLGVWLLRAVWAKLTGQPVNPWKFQVDRQAMWNRFYRPPGSGQGQQAPGQDAGWSAAQRRDDADVIDVEPKSIKPPQG
jgi:hypothetical protein